MHVLTSSGSPSLLFFTISGSAKNGLAMDMRSALPFASIDSTVEGALIRFVAQSGTDTIFSSRNFLVTKEDVQMAWEVQLPFMH